MDKKKGIIVILIAAVAIWYFMGGEPEATPAGDGDNNTETPERRQPPLFALRNEMPREDISSLRFCSVLLQNVLVAVKELTKT